MCMVKGKRKFLDKGCRVVFTQIQACVGEEHFGERAVVALLK